MTEPTGDRAWPERVDPAGATDPTPPGYRFIPLAQLPEPEPDLPPQTPLYHYTTAEGLIGIIGTGAIWATNVFYLNDASEITYGREVFDSYIEQRFPKIGEVSSQEMIENFVFLLRLGPESWGDPMHGFVACFSKAPDSLSQWRGYGEGTNGFAIGFAPEALERAAHGTESTPAFELQRVIYERDQQLSTLDRAVGDAIQDFANYYTEVEPGLRDPEEAMRLLMSCTAATAFSVTRFKAKAFHEEEEWRALNFMLDEGLHKYCHFRPTHVGVTPYVNLAVIDPDALSEAITEVWIGPTVHRDLAYDAVRSLLQARGLTGVEIIHSSIPLR